MPFGNIRIWWWPAAGALGAGGAAITGWLGGWWWVFDLCSPFQLQYAVVLALCLIALLLLRRWRWAVLAAVLLLLPALRLAPCYCRGPAETGVGTRPLRVLSFNVLSSNRDFAGVLRWVRENDPEVAFFAEVTPEWANALEELRDTLPYSSVTPRPDNFGHALFAKYPLGSTRHLSGEMAVILAIRAELEIDGSRVVVIGAHPPPPLSATMARERSRMLQLFADEARAVTGPLIIMGDLNATPWCQDMRPMWSAGLRDARRGPHFGPTWQADNPLFAIPIDHLLLKGAVAVESCRTGPPLGSDHRGLAGVLRL